ncbi:MAG TPA: serine hydrolase domain-containing protein, partial [Herpetosiphonaceae bacterium]
APAVAPSGAGCSPACAAPAAPASPGAAASPAADAPPASGQSSAPAVDLPGEFQAILDFVVADGYVPGAVMAVRLADGTTWSGAAGVYDWESAEPMRPDTPVYIGSVSKLFTAAIVLQLWEEGRLDLDAPVAAWLPDLLPDGESITPRHLLQHTSGLYDYLEDPGLLGAAYDDPGARWSPAEIVGAAAAEPLAFVPGSAGNWSYSSTNYVALGMLVEAVTGRPLAEETHRRILEPLGLRHTFVAPADDPGEPLPQGYVNTRLVPQAPASFVFGTAHIISTVADLQRFGGALFGGELLGPAAEAEMRGFVDGHEAFDVPGLAYGLGLMRGRLRVGAAADGAERDPALRTALGHMGGFAGFRAAVWYAPESGALITLGLTQTDIDPNEVAARALDAVLRAGGR